MFPERPVNSMRNAFTGRENRSPDRDPCEPLALDEAVPPAALPWESAPFKIFTTSGVWPVQNSGGAAGDSSATIQSGSGGSGTVLPASEFVLSRRNSICPARMKVWQTDLPAPVS